MQSQFYTFKPLSFAGKWAVMSVILNIIALSSFGQAVGDFRSNATGAWNNVNTWQRFNGTIWVNPAPATPSSSDGAISIQAGHTVNVPNGFSVTVDQVVIANSASIARIVVDNGGTLIVADGTGTDITLGTAGA